MTWWWWFLLGAVGAAVRAVLAHSLPHFPIPLLSLSLSSPVSTFPSLSLPLPPSLFLLSLALSGIGIGTPTTPFLPPLPRNSYFTALSSRTRFSVTIAGSRGRARLRKGWVMRSNHFLSSLANPHRP